MNYWVLKSLKDFIKFNGRSCRTESRYFLIFNILIGVSAGLIDMLMGFTIEIIPGIPTLILSEITRGILILPNTSLIIRRLHDINKSGWWMLLFFTIVGIIPMLYWLYFKEGDQYENNYGTIDIIIND
ncbi:MAG: DUF805 domain-containing protein [Candidatus Marinimicrobia bacterium]|jgi:uncharacterized membrane protein YhaH (DUF805 family)|nr:DUF805 domain-containing protein [Candidatus Neomarinimicrobiota bacterium]MBT4370972.1 DUF805 domain-containing protein [Candidatus Neomarinimicrobiota bacterium]MBT4827658.1 DUF805 domain-containing protein [Candidatus Neomarinimicrobiota bacterium]MBT6518175.1 DUF805 domain-containing protein [Candidatus Neomarinimicrobiota bacterium]MBT7119306.1 DUF805 domain-containing protein [Candidatus Neomarinimicrobiota bacterium]